MFRVAVRWQLSPSCQCLSLAHEPRFLAPARQIGRVDFPHPAFSWDHAFAHGRPFVVCSGVRAIFIVQPLIGEAHVFPRLHLDDGVEIVVLQPAPVPALALGSNC